MPVYDRTDPTDYERVDEFDGGVGWIVHPNETNTRTSHAVACEDGVWVLDPLDAPGVDDLVAELGTVAGVAVCSSYHARDAGRVARRHGVAVHAPRWMDRVEERVDAPLQRFEDRLGGSGFRVLRCEPFPRWQEAMLYREADATLYVPDSLGTTPLDLVGDERLGVNVARRLQPPRGLLGDLSPDRVLLGHGTGVFEDAEGALADALSGARKRLPRALAASGSDAVRAVVGALRE